MWFLNLFKITLLIYKIVISIIHFPFYKFFFNYYFCFIVYSFFHNDSKKKDIHQLTELVDYLKLIIYLLYIYYFPKITNNKYKNDQSINSQKKYMTTELPGTGGENLSRTNQDHGLYVCIKCHQPLYSAIQKVKSTDWPLFNTKISNHTNSFTFHAQPDPERHEDDALEVQCPKCFSHLGHIFNGPRKFGHCVNSYAIIFQPLSSKSKLIRYAGVIPVSRDSDNNWRILVGQESPVNDWSNSLTWSDFGGGQESMELKLESESQSESGSGSGSNGSGSNGSESNGSESGVDNEVILYAEDHIKVASREFEEEIMGILGCKYEIENMLNDRGIKYELVDGQVVEYLLQFRWKEVQHAPKFFENVRKHFLKCSTKNKKGFVVIESCPKGTMEKIKIEWVKLADIIYEIKLAADTKERERETSSLKTNIILSEESKNDQNININKNTNTLTQAQAQISRKWRPSFARSLMTLYEIGAFDDPRLRKRY